MKRVYGIITGMGAFAGSHLYESINYEIASLNNFRDADDSVYPELWIHQIPFRDSDYLGDSDYQSFREAIENSLVRMESMNVTHVAFACNTYDHDFEEIAKKYSFEYISITRLVRTAVRKVNPKKLSILASRQSIENNVHDYEFFTQLAPAEQEKVDALILSSMSGRAMSGQQLFDEVIEELEEDGAGYHLLGCTELSVYNPYPENSHLIDSTKLLAKYIAKDYHENKK